jgi:hypothetical protein
MAQAVDNRFADGWQKVGKKDYSATIHEQGKVAAQTAKVEEKASRAAHAATKAGEVVGKQLKQAVQTGKEPPQVQQKIQIDAQTANVVKAKAAENFLEAQADARMLSQLSTKAPQINRGADFATQQAVVQKSLAPQVDQQSKGAKQPSAEFAAGRAVQDKLGAKKGEGSARHAKSAEHRAKAGEGSAEQVDPFKKTQSAEQLAKQPAAAPGAAVAGQIKGEHRVDAGESQAPREGDKGTEGTEQSRDASSFTVGPHASKGTSKELGSLLGGSAGDGQGAQGEGGSNAAIEGNVKRAAAAPLPEKDPNLHIYSEFDEANPGIDILKSKAQLYANHVEKRLKDIAKLDGELGEKIRNIIETAPLSERVKGELAGMLKSSDFHRSVYGGLLG